LKVITRAFHKRYVCVAIAASRYLGTIVFRCYCSFLAQKSRSKQNAGDGEEVDIMFVMMLECKQ